MWAAARSGKDGNDAINIIIILMHMNNNILKSLGEINKIKVVW